MEAVRRIPVGDGNEKSTVAWIARNVYAADRSYQVHKEDHPVQRSLTRGPLSTREC